MSNKKLQIEQLDTKMQAYSRLKTVPGPGNGWIKAIRSAIGMSLVQLGNRLNITKQSVQEIEQRERDGSITLKSLEDVARALDMKLVYGFIAKDGSLEALIDRKANELATRIVKRTSNSMKLEDQENTEQRIKKAIAERSDELRRELPKILWD